MKFLTEVSNAFRIGKMRILEFFLFGVCTMLFVSCTLMPQPPEISAISTTTVFKNEMQATPTLVNKTEEAVFVTSISLIDGEPESGSVEVVINGFFPDGCTRPIDVKQSRNKSDFSIRIFTERIEDDDCNIMMEPFTLYVPLDVRDFMAGQISTVTVYDLWLEFAVGQEWRPNDEGD